MKIKDLIEAYQTDPLSTYHKLRFCSKRDHNNLLKRIVSQYGGIDLSKVNARTILGWHADWSAGNKLAMGQSFVKRFRTLLGFGLTLLENEDCRRLRLVMSTLRFEDSKPRTKTLSFQQVVKICELAHAQKWHSIALAQAFQFELMLRQKDIIGEWVPQADTSASSSICYKDKLWARGIIWSEIDDNLILKHTTSKKQKPIEVDLKECSLVMQELRRCIGNKPQGPLIVSEYTGLPYTDFEFRRKWRILADRAGVPKGTFNMDTRAGAISEAFEAQADADWIRASATHSDLSQTMKYNRGNHLKKSAGVMQKRISIRPTLPLSLPAL